MINIVQQLPINTRTSEVLCASGLQLKIMQVGYTQTPHAANITFECNASDTGEAIKFVAFSDNYIHLEDQSGNEWQDKVIAVVDDMGYPIYSTQAEQEMQAWIHEVNHYAIMMVLLIIGSAFIASQNIYVAIPFIGMALLAVLGFSKEYRKVKHIFRVWGKPDTIFNHT